MNSAESVLIGTDAWYIAHARKRFIALEAQAAVLEAQSIALNAQLQTLRREIESEIVTATEEVLIAAHRDKHQPKNVVQGVF